MSSGVCALATPLSTSPSPHVTLVNPAAVKAGDSIATKQKNVIDPETGEDAIVVTKSRKVKKVGFCPGKPEMIHLDHECYDTRFTTVVLAS